MILYIIHLFKMTKADYILIVNKKALRIGEIVSKFKNIS